MQGIYKDPEARRAYQKAYYLAHRAEIRARQKDYYQKNKEELKKASNERYRAKCSALYNSEKG